FVHAKDDTKWYRRKGLLWQGTPRTRHGGGLLTYLTKKSPWHREGKTSYAPRCNPLCLPTHHEDKCTILPCLDTMGQVCSENCPSPLDKRERRLSCCRCQDDFAR